MPQDGLLDTLLLRLQDPPDAAQTESLLGTTAHLLATLTNPLNVAVLTTQFLASPAIWHRPLLASLHPPPPPPPPPPPRLLAHQHFHDDLATCLRVVSVYNTAAGRVRSGTYGRELARELAGAASLRRLGCDPWAKAVAAGLDGTRSRRWQHLLVLTGVLVGMGYRLDGVPAPAAGLSAGMRSMLEEAVVRAVNLSLEAEAPRTDGPAAGAAVVLALAYALPLLSPHSAAHVNHDALLPLAVWAMTDAPTFQRGAFLVPIRRESTRIPGQATLHWPAAAPSFQNVAGLLKSPLVTALGPVSKLAAHAVRHARDPRAVREVQADLAERTGEVLVAWRELALAAVDPVEEAVVLSSETQGVTVPVLWQLLHKLLFGVVTVLQSVASRTILDPGLAGDAGASIDTLRALRHLYFVSSRGGTGNFEAYIFTFLAAVDLLSRFPARCEAFLREIVPSTAGAVPLHPVDRTLDLFYLNLVEHLAVVLPPAACEALIVRPALTYLAPPVSSLRPGASTSAAVVIANLPPPLLVSSPLTAELFEASHSAILSTLSVPHNAPITATLVPPYADALSAAFPSRISPRQFRVALCTVVRIASPPFPASAAHPDLAESLLEMVRFRALTAGTAPIPPRSPRETGAEGGGGDVPVSEQSTLVLALIDALPHLPLGLVEEWLTIAAGLMGEVRDPALRGPVRARFRDVLVSGEMDVERAALGVAWWGGGGRDLVGSAPSGSGPEVAVMSGALSVQRESQL